MRCASYCTGSEYNIEDIVAFCSQIALDTKQFDDVLYIQKKYPKDQSCIDIFVFPFGCITIWGATEKQEKDIIKQLIDALNCRTNELEFDFIYFDYDESAEKTFIDEENNKIVLADKHIFTKLSISYALAQSVKLSVLEESVSNLISNTMPIQQELARTGSVSLSKKEISKQIGILFSERYSIHLHSDVLNTPEFFWRRPSYEPLYLKTTEFQDIQVRQNILHHRLDMIHELYEILSNDLN